MKKIKFINLIIYCLIFTICCSVIFAGEKDTGTTTAVFLKIPTGARPSGMGSAFAGISNDINSLYYNPAGAAQIKTIEATATQVQWISEMTNTYLGVAIPFGINVFGLGITYFSAGELEIRDDNGNLVSGKNSVYDMATSIIFSRSLGETLSVGINAKTITQKYGNETGSGNAFDFGILRKIERFSVGLNIQNLGSKIKFGNVSNNLPTNIKLGIGYRFGENTLIGLDIDSPNDGSIKIHTGVELLFRNMFFIRAGYDQIDSKFDFQKGLTFGFGMKPSAKLPTEEAEEISFEKMEAAAEGKPGMKPPEMQLDYSLFNFPDFGPSHRISISIKFK